MSLTRLQVCFSEKNDIVIVENHDEETNYKCMPILWEPTIGIKINYLSSFNLLLMLANENVENINPHYMLTFQVQMENKRKSHF